MKSMRSLHPTISALSLGYLLALPTSAHADNPIVQTLYTADPAPMVYEDTLYLYTTHDEDVTVNDFFTMNDWRVYSSKDVVNWTDHGSPLHYNDFAWAGGSAWAGQVIHRNDKFYFYVPVVRSNGSNAIGVATSDSPLGPFQDAIGAPLVTSDCGDIDPTPFIDDDGQAYLYWGNPNLCYVKLNEDMVSYQGNVERVSLTTQSFGVRSNTDRATSYEEGPWFYKREQRYYLVYPGGPLPEHIAYSTSDGPTGPWTYRDVIMPAEGGSFTNHPGVVDFGGKSFFFYHNAALPGGGGFKRSVSVEEFSYGADGSIPELHMTTEGPDAVAALNPFAQVEAETIAWQTGIETEVCDEGGINVTSIDSGDFIKVKEVEFGAGANSLTARVAAAAGGGKLELRLDARDGALIGTCAIEGTGGERTWASQTCTVEGASEKHDLFLVFTSGGFKFNWWRFDGPGAMPVEGEGGAGNGSGGSGDGSGGTGSAAAGAGATPDDNTSGGAPAAGGKGAVEGAGGEPSAPPTASTTTPSATSTGSGPSTAPTVTPQPTGSSPSTQPTSPSTGTQSPASPTDSSEGAMSPTSEVSEPVLGTAPVSADNSSDASGCSLTLESEHAHPRAPLELMMLGLLALGARVSRGRKQRR